MSCSQGGHGKAANTTRLLTDRLYDAGTARHGLRLESPRPTKEVIDTGAVPTPVDFQCVPWTETHIIAELLYYK